MDRAPVSVGTAIDFRLFFQNVLATLVHTTFPCDINGHEIRAFISEKKNTLLQQPIHSTESVDQITSVNHHQAFIKCFCNGIYVHRYF